ncbi:MAG: hypothetical protein LBU86_02385 [Oscillospiraceae bacterium]|nr:hypothetical protein [Oscillospiraceae bacterium]
MSLPVFGRIGYNQARSESAVFIRTRGLVLLALFLMMALVLTGAGSVWADISEEKEHIAACDRLALTLAPAGLIHEYVRGFLEEDDILLRALHADKAAGYTFDFSSDDCYPVAVIWPPSKSEPPAAPDSGAVKYLAELEFIYEDGSREIREYDFEFRRFADGRWQIVSRGFPEE